MTNADQPAFPNLSPYVDVPDTGLTKREYFAAMAMQGMITAITKFRNEPTMNDIIVHRPVDVAEISVVYADALLKQLSQ